MTAATPPAAAPRRTRAAAPPPPPPVTVPASSLRVWWEGLSRLIRVLLVLLIGLPLLLCLCTLCTSSYYLGLPWLNARRDDINRIAQTAQATAQPQPTIAPQQPQQPQPTPLPPLATSVPSRFNTNEPLMGSLDDFGRKVRYDDRFPPNGEIWDQSYNPGEIFVANALAVHDQSFKSQNGCVIAYYQAPTSGGRIRFTGFDGQGFELNADSGVSLSQAVAAMRETLVRAHRCDPTRIQYHELSRYGNPVK